MRGERGNFTLIGLLVVVVIIVAVGAVYFGGIGRTTVKDDSQLLDEHSGKKTVVGKAIDTAKGEDCRERLGNIRKGLEVYKAMEPAGANPASLNDLKMSVSSDYFQCPVSKKPYVYDANTGKVSCLYEGHADL